MERQLGKSTLEDDARRLLTWVRQEAGGLTHNVLSATHPDTIAGAVTRGDLIVGESTSKWTGLAVGSAGWVVGTADGLDVTYLDPTLTLPLAPVAQGDLIIADATPAWSILTLGAAAGYALVSTATTAVWDQTPEWSGLHTFAAGWILSGGLADLAGIADALVLDGDGDTTISAPTDDQIDIEIAGADDFTFTAGSFNVLASSYITMADDTWIGLGAAAGRLVFDSTPAADEIRLVSGVLDLNGIADALVLDGDGDTSISAPTDDQIDVEIAGADDFTFTAGSFNVLGGSFITLADDAGIGAGTGAIRLEVDTTPAIDLMNIQGGHIGIGYVGTDDALVRLAATNEHCRMNLEAYDDLAANYSYIRLRKSHTDTLGTLVQTVDGEAIGGIVFYGVDTDPDWDYGAVIRVWQEGAAGVQVPTLMRLYTHSSTAAHTGIAIDSAGKFGVNISASISAQCHIDQASPTAAQPVLLLDQADVSEEFIWFIGTAAAGVVTQSIVDEGDQASETREGWLKVYVNDIGNQITDQAYYVPIYSLSA